MNVLVSPANKCNNTFSWSHLHITLSSPSAHTSCLSIPRCSLILYLFERLQRWNELCFIISTCTSVCSSIPLHYKRGLWPLLPMLSFKAMWDLWKIEWNGWLSLAERAWFCMSGYSLVEEGKQVTHHHQRRPRDTQQDLTDALCSFIQVFDSCGRKHTEQSPWVAEASQGVRNTMIHPKRHQPALQKQRQSAPYLCWGGDEFRET